MSEIQARRFVRAHQDRPKNAFGNRFWQTSHCAGPGSERNPVLKPIFRGMKARGGWGPRCSRSSAPSIPNRRVPLHFRAPLDQGDVLNLATCARWRTSMKARRRFKLCTAAANAPSARVARVRPRPSQWLSAIFATRSVYGCEMDELDIRTVINMYVEAGKRAEQAGFDLLEVFPPATTRCRWQFLEPRFNRRTDDYGGALRNRSRFFIRNSCAR